MEEENPRVITGLSFAKTTLGLSGSVSARLGISIEPAFNYRNFLEYRPIIISSIFTFFI
jgi:hypothetical protein